MKKTTVVFEAPANGNKEQRHGLFETVTVNNLNEARKLIKIVDNFLSQTGGKNYLQASICSPRKYIKLALGNCNPSEIIVNGNNFDRNYLKNLLRNIIA